MLIYTLYYPHFYEVLDSFDTAKPTSPLFLFQGVWMEEELPGYNQDLYFLDASFNNEIEANKSLSIKSYITDAATLGPL